MTRKLIERFGVAPELGAVTAVTVQGFEEIPLSNKYYDPFQPQRFFPCSQRVEDSCSDSSEKSSAHGRFSLDPQNFSCLMGRSQSPAFTEYSPLDKFYDTDIILSHFNHQLPPPVFLLKPFTTNPSLRMALFDINQRPPFRDPMETLGIQAYDVIKIKNVPFGVTIPEIRSFVSRLTSSPLIRDHQQGYPVHIIMERPTGKTMDCFVEFQFEGGAKAAVSRAEQTLFDGKSLKIGARHIDVEMSSEGELCAALFPRAKSVKWDSKTGIPTVVVNQDPYSEGFQGFFTVEEMSSICKQASTPQKSTFSQRCQQRVYESMISTLYKFPWHVPQHYTVNARNFLWTVYMDLLHNLVARVQPSSEPSMYGSLDKEVGLSHSLLMEYLFAGLNVQMFSFRQKFMIVHAAGTLGAGFRLPEQAINWPFHSLVPSHTCTSEVLTEWLGILESGFHKALTYGIQHGYENYLRLGRDEAGRMKFELNENGRGLNFKDLISMELGLMEFLVEEGRSEHCSRYDIPYQKLNLRGRPRPSPHVEIDAGMHCMTLASPKDENPFRLDDYDNQFDGFGPAVPNSPHSQTFSIDGDLGMDDVHQGLVADPIIPAKPLRGIQFNPATPPFIPSQPWQGVSGIGAAGNSSAMHDSPQSPGGVRIHPLALESSWAPQEFQVNSTSVANKSHGHRRTSSRDFGRGSMSGFPLFDPFDTKFPPGGPRKTSLKSNIRTITGQVVGNTGPERNDQPTYGKDTVAGTVLPPLPIFNNIWGPPNAVPVGHGSQRRAISDGSGSANGSPSRNSRSSSVSNVQPKTNLTTTEPAPNTKATAPVYKAANAFEPDPAGQNADKRSWLWGSPVRNSLSRSSTGRNNLRIDATINEEGDGVDDDAATDAGGVSL